MANRQRPSVGNTGDYGRDMHPLKPLAMIRANFRRPVDLVDFPVYGTTTAGGTSE